MRGFVCTIAALVRRDDRRLAPEFTVDDIGPFALGSAFEHANLA
jgi:hypothetical protein